MMHMTSLVNSKKEERDTVSTNYAIITLTPKKEIFTVLRKISKQLLGTTETELNKYLDTDCLESHTVPVYTPLFESPSSLHEFVKDNSEVLIDIMLASWPFPIDAWEYTNKNIDFFNTMIDMTYYPIVCKAITKPITSTLDLAVTFATPTKELTDYVVESIVSKKMELTEEEMTTLEFMLNTGVAIITNPLDKIESKDPLRILDYYKNLNRLEKYLEPLNVDTMELLLGLYFDNKTLWPQDANTQQLSKWFNTKTFLGLYIPIAIESTGKFF